MPAEQFVSIRDYVEFAKAMVRDPQHAELNPDEFLNDPKTETFVWRDEHGPVLYFRISREARVDVQFRPDIEIERTRAGLEQGLAWLEDQLRPNFRAIVFDSVYRPLIVFAKRRLKFQESPDLRKVI